MFINFVHSSLDEYKPELLEVAYSLFVHAVIALIPGMRGASGGGVWLVVG